VWGSMRFNVARSRDLVGTNDAGLNRRWGLRAGPWLWATRIRILFVVDGRVDLSKLPDVFGLAFVLDTLRDTSFAWWVRFEVDVARRAPGPPIVTEQPGPYQERYLNFRFTQPGFTLDDYDQVWFFGIWPDNHESSKDADIENPEYTPLDDAELKLLAEWMDRGGGVFAAGDHDYLGASMCYRIPRVKTMRKWTHAQGVPLQDGPSRHQTLQPMRTTNADAWEKDEFPQPIEPLLRETATSLAIRTLIPHPILCAPDGVIDRFPDHMHEGEVIRDADVTLNQPLGIPGYTRPEYPPATQSGGPRPRPQVIAFGRTTHLAEPIRFGVVGVYDGDSAGIGRVVVDSTWHHWFSLNLDSLSTGNPPVYERMQAYYRNVGLWLATPAQRASMLLAATWGVIVSDPMAFPISLKSLPWYLGEKAVDVIGRTATQCTLFDLSASWLDAQAVDEVFFVPEDAPPSEPCLSCLPIDVLTRAMVGGVAAELLETASEYHEALLHGQRPRLKPRLLARHVERGAKSAHEALVALARDGRAANHDSARRLAEGFRAIPADAIPVPVEIVRLRVVIDRVQLTDPGDPATVDGHVTLTARAKLTGSVVAIEVLEDVPVPDFTPAGAFVEVDRVLVDEPIQSGEDLTVEILEGAWGLDAAPADGLRFRDTLRGDPSTWVGTHNPTRQHSWRLWYRIERAEANA
jgi:hypothetical protein